MKLYGIVRREKTVVGMPESESKHNKVWEMHLSLALNLDTNNH